MSRTGHGIALLIGGLLLSGCGPTAAEAGAAALLAAPGIILLGAGILECLSRFWRRAGVKLTLEWGTLIRWTALAIVIGVAAGLFVAGDPWRWVALAFAIVGTSYLTCLLLIWRTLLHIRVERAFIGAQKVAAMLVFSPAAPMLFLAGEGEVARPVIVVWYYSGCVGITTAIVLVCLGLELPFRIRAYRRRASASDAGSGPPRAE